VAGDEVDITGAVNVPLVGTFGAVNAELERLGVAAVVGDAAGEAFDGLFVVLRRAGMAGDELGDDLLLDGRN
jgi:hypothetical protein